MRIFSSSKNKNIRPDRQDDRQSSHVSSAEYDEVHKRLQDMKSVLKQLSRNTDEVSVDEAVRAATRIRQIADSIGSHGPDADKEESKSNRFVSDSVSRKQQVPQSKDHRDQSADRSNNRDDGVPTETRVHSTKNPMQNVLADIKQQRKDHSSHDIQRTKQPVIQDTPKGDVARKIQMMEAKLKGEPANPTTDYSQSKRSPSPFQNSHRKSAPTNIQTDEFVGVRVSDLAQRFSSPTPAAKRVPLRTQQQQSKGTTYSNTQHKNFSIQTSLSNEIRPPSSHEYNSHSERISREHLAIRPTSSVLPKLVDDPDSYHSPLNLVEIESMSSRSNRSIYRDFQSRRPSLMCSSRKQDDIYSPASSRQTGSDSARMSLSGSLQRERAAAESDSSSEFRESKQGRSSISGIDHDRRLYEDAGNREFQQRRSRSVSKGPDGRTIRNQRSKSVNSRADKREGILRSIRSSIHDLEGSNAVDTAVESKRPHLVAETRWPQGDGYRADYSTSSRSTVRTGRETNNHSSKPGKQDRHYLEKATNPRSNRANSEERRRDNMPVFSPAADSKRSKSIPRSRAAPVLEIRALHNPRIHEPSTYNPQAEWDYRNPHYSFDYQPGSPLMAKHSLVSPESTISSLSTRSLRAARIRKKIWKMICGKLNDQQKPMLGTGQTHTTTETTDTYGYNQHPTSIIPAHRGGSYDDENRYRSRSNSPNHDRNDINFSAPILKNSVSFVDNKRSNSPSRYGHRKHDQLMSPERNHKLVHELDTDKRKSPYHRQNLSPAKSFGAVSVSNRYRSLDDEDNENDEHDEEDNQIQRSYTNSGTTDDTKSRASMSNLSGSTGAFSMAELVKYMSYKDNIERGFEILLGDSEDFRKQCMPEKVKESTKEALKTSSDNVALPRIRDSRDIPTSPSIVATNSRFLPPSTSNLSSSKDRTKALLANLETPREYTKQSSSNLKRIQEKKRPSLEQIPSKSFYDRAPFIDKQPGGTNIRYDLDSKSVSSSSLPNTRTRELLRE